ncbi:uncharacterized protein LOC134838086 [Culicoides brevitarsis]|uniref:uncharacterized protein LOC134838086 n=1 Tax=Culicoides brevitarsis TaxID=469753 RepID=UPI00307B6249
MAQNSQDEQNTIAPPQNVTYVATLESGGQQNAVVSHRRTISIVSQSTLSADVFLTPQSVRHEDFVKKSWLENAHKRSASASSFFSVVSEKEKQKSEMTNMVTVNGFANPGYLDEPDFTNKGQNGTLKYPVREQYWTCTTLSSRERIFVGVIIVLTLIVITLMTILLYKHFCPDKDIEKYLPPWIQGRSTDER